MPQEIYLYNPENFEPLDILPPSLKKFADDARYFIHKLYVSQVYDKRNKNKFLPLKAAYLRRIISERKYPLIKKALLDSETITTDNHWIRGKKAIGYLLGAKFKQSRHHRVLITNKRLIRKILQYDEPYIKEISLDVHKHLKKYLEEIEINYSEAILNIEEDFGVHELSVGMIRDKKWFLKPDKYGRVHTNITNLKSKLRKYLSWKEKTLVNIDIQNSQPFFLGILLLDYHVNHGSFSPSFNNIPPLHPLPCDILPPDVRDFVKLVSLGKIYEYIAANAGHQIENRKDFKRKLFRQIFFCKNKYWDTSYSRLFNKLFPNVSSVIKEIKRKDYTSLAKLLQRVESSFVINGVVRKCMDEFPEMPLFTIHDSVMTVDNWVDTLRLIILGEFGKVGVVPQLTVERY